MKITYIICWCIIELAFIAMSVFLSIWFGSLHFLWFLAVAIIGFFDTSMLEEKSTDKPTDDKSDPFDLEEK